MLSIYPACFFKEDNGYSVIFPDLNYLATQGDTLEDAVAMAVDCLAYGRVSPPAGAPSWWLRLAVKCLYELCLQAFYARRNRRNSPSMARFLLASASVPRHFCALQHNSTDTKQLRYSPTRQYRLPPPPTYATHIIALRSFANVFFSIRDMATWLRPSTSATCFCVLSCI